MTHAATESTSVEKPASVFAVRRRVVPFSEFERCMKAARSEATSKLPNHMKDSNRLKEAQKQIEIVAEHRDVAELPAIRQELLETIQRVESDE